MSVFETTFYLLYKDNGGHLRERSNVILHEADSVEQAVADAVRFYKNRVGAEVSMPIEVRYWTPIGAMKVHMMNIRPIAADGSYATMRAMRAYEWKCDFPWPLGEGNW